METKPIYDHQAIEDKWLKQWDESQIYSTDEHSAKQKFYALDTFVYPSGTGVTIGHYKSFGSMDVIARYKRMKGYNVLYPTGWDTFGLPAENFAIKTGRHPREITEENIKNYIHQYKSAGLSYDWSREINTADPEFYKWTQWLFLVMYKNSLAYRKKSPVQWCNSCKTVIAKEQVIDENICERCGSQVIEKELEQWFFKITDYADRLDKDIEKLDWDDRYKNPHRAWIGKKINENGEATYHLHDWCVSRQRYWGPPIPIIYCDTCGTVPVPEDQLPVLLPHDVNYVPTGESPLAKDPGFIETNCPNCGGKARREADILDTFVSSSWYQFRFADPHNTEAFANPQRLQQWLPVDHYEGTIEHLTAHLIYARFVAKVLFDAGYITFDEPFPKYTPVGLLVDKNGTKFSKRLGNAPDTNMLIEKYGGDLLRLSCYFISPFEDISKWGEENVIGVARFRDRIWRLFNKGFSDAKASSEMMHSLYRLVKAVEENIERMNFNVVMSNMMVFVSELNKYEEAIPLSIWNVFTRLLAPFAPFMAEEMWHQMGNTGSIHTEAWPKYEQKYIDQERISMIVQINGKTKGVIEADVNSEQEVVEELVKASQLLDVLGDSYKVIFVQNKLINFIS